MPDSDPATKRLRRDAFSSSCPGATALKASEKDAKQTAWYMATAARGGVTPLKNPREPSLEKMRETAAAVDEKYDLCMWTLTVSNG
mmetsp:Transcript_83674/g.167593  ORF Transcript_83674/g.167593 Transcript_83674/m.167593 type:complete len:86 (+) Transcript_83674:196-453(+)